MFRSSTEKSGMREHIAWRTLIWVNDLIYRVFMFVAAIAVTLIVVSVFYQVFGRYVLEISTPWPEETAIFCLVWGAILGMALGVRDHSHLVADLLPENLGPLLDKLLPTLTHLVHLIIAIVFIRWGSSYAEMGLTRDSMTLGYTMFYMYVSVPICGVAMLLFVTERFIDLWWPTEGK